MSIRNAYESRAEREDQDAWMEEALCAEIGGEIFFPERGEGPAEAKAVCAACPVRDQCLAHALLNKEPHGIWGGMTEGERRALLDGSAARKKKQQRASDARVYELHRLLGSKELVAERLGTTARTVSYAINRHNRRQEPADENRNREGA